MKILTLLFAFLVCSFIVQAQEVELQIDGAIKIGTTTDPTPDPGTIRWTGSDLEVYKNGAWVSLTEGGGGPSAGSLTDIDGNTYNTIVVGGKEYMAENLRTTKYRNGTSIPYITNQTTWQTSTAGAFCWQGNDPGNENPYGKLYNWHAVADTHGLCPSGWSVPTQLEWAALSAALGGNTVAGGKMKESGTAHWENPNIGATNSSGFTGLPGGSRSTSFVGLGTWGNYWASTPSGSSSHFVYLNNQQASFVPTTGAVFTGMSVRCMKD